MVFHARNIPDDMTQLPIIQGQPSDKVACEDCNLARICLPRDLEDSDIKDLAHVVRRNRSLRKDETLYRAGERFTGLYALKSGSAKLVHTDRLGRNTLISVVLPGELFGFDGLTASEHRCTLVALETSRYCELASHDLEPLARKIPAVQQVLLERSCEQMDQAVEQLAANSRPAEERLAGFLLDLACRYRRRGFPSESFHLRLTRQEVGNHLGLALETVSRILSRLQSVNIINVQGKRIQILDRQSLEVAAGQSVDSSGFSAPAVDPGQSGHKKPGVPSVRKPGA